MNAINKTIAGLELAQIGWVVPDIRATMEFLSSSLGIPSFPEPDYVRAQDLNMTYQGSVVEADWLTTQTYSGGSFIELIQPISGQSMFQDYLDRYPQGGTQHLAFQLPIRDFERVISQLQAQNHKLISEVDHPIAQMTFFDTYQVLGVAIEIMGVKPDGWAAIDQMRQGK